MALLVESVSRSSGRWSAPSPFQRPGRATSLSLFGVGGVWCWPPRVLTRRSGSVQTPDAGSTVAAQAETKPIIKGAGAMSIDVIADRAEAPSTAHPDPQATSTHFPHRHHDHRRHDLATTAVGLLTIQLVLAYEWLVSGFTKLWRGGFPTGLAAELSDKSQGVTGWYKSFLDSVVIPHGWAVGWLVMIGELAVGAAFATTAIVILVRGTRLRFATRQVTFAVIALAGIAGIIMNLAFHFANGAPHPWWIPKDGFDEGVDLDSLMPLVQLSLVIVASKLYLVGRHTHRHNNVAELDGPSNAEPLHS